MSDLCYDCGLFAMSRSASFACLSWYRHPFCSREGKKPEDAATRISHKIACIVIQLLHSTNHQRTLVSHRLFGQCACRSRLRPPPEFRENPLDWFEQEARISRRYDHWVSTACRGTQDYHGASTPPHTSNSDPGDPASTVYYVERLYGCAPFSLCILSWYPVLVFQQRPSGLTTDDPYAVWPPTARLHQAHVLPGRFTNGGQIQWYTHSRLIKTDQ